MAALTLQKDNSGVNPPNCSEVFITFSFLENLTVIFWIDLPNDDALVALCRRDHVVHFFSRHGGQEAESSDRG
jgi:hypothetical protein